MKEVRAARNENEAEKIAFNVKEARRKREARKRKKSTASRTSEPNGEVIETNHDEEPSEYEQLRERNIAECKLKLKQSGLPKMFP